MSDKYLLINAVFNKFTLKKKKTMHLKFLTFVNFYYIIHKVR